MRGSVSKPNLLVVSKGLTNSLFVSKDLTVRDLYGMET